MSVIKSTKKTKLILLALAEAAMLLLSSCAKSDRTQSIEYLSEKYSVPEEKQLVVYTSHKEEVYLPIIREFENQTGIWVEIHAGGTEEMMNEARKASESGQCDIIFGGVVYQIGEKANINITGKDILLFDRQSGRLICAGSLEI